MFLKSFTEEACTTCAGRLFHRLIILHVKKYYLVTEPMVCAILYWGNVGHAITSVTKKGKNATTSVVFCCVFRQVSERAKLTCLMQKIGHVGNESIQAVNCAGTDNRT